MLAKRHLLLITAAVMLLLSACGTAAPAPTCGADLCITEIRFLTVDESTTALAFYLTDADGGIDPANPPTFATGMNLRLTDDSGEIRLVEGSFAPDAFSCIAGDNVPGREGSLAAACIFPIDRSTFSIDIAPNSDVMLTIYNDTFPLFMSRLTMP